jgi:hypothetical protein
MFLCGSEGMPRMHSNDSVQMDNGYALLPGSWAIVTAPQPYLLPSLTWSMDGA